MLSPELWQNIAYTIYFTLLHNAIALIYFTGLFLSTALSLYKPSRKATLLMLGFACLLFSFEYSKHIVEALREQTVNSVITMTPHYKLERLITVALSKLLPIFLNIVGFGSLALAGFLHFRKVNRK